eukprot:SAG31_NODE_5456_length_2526_cov_1.722291_3_plen_390_part_00
MRCSWQIEDDPIPGEHPYISHLRDRLRAGGVTGLISTLSGPDGDSIEGMKVHGDWVALEYSITTNASKSLATLRSVIPDGNPMVTMEIYPGWIDVEGGSHTTVAPQVFTTAIEKVLALDGTVDERSLSSVSIYMLHGGTNFGFLNGANVGYNGPGYHAIITSYDYDAPITEAGDAGTKFEPLRQLFAKHGSSGSPAPPPSPKGAYGRVSFKKSAELLDPAVLSALCPLPLKSPFPVGMEAAGQGYGWILYEHSIPAGTRNGSATLSVSGILQDQGQVLVDRTWQGTLGWGFQASAAVNVQFSGRVQTLQILVENKGRCDSSGMGEHDIGCARKGVYGNFTLGAEVTRACVPTVLSTLSLANSPPTQISVGRYWNRLLQAGRCISCRWVA